MSRAAAVRRRISSLLDYLPFTCRAGLVEWEIKGRARDIREALEDSRVCRQEGRTAACWCGKNMTRELRAKLEAEAETLPERLSAAAKDGPDPWAATDRTSTRSAGSASGAEIWRMCRGCGCTQDAACFLSDQPCHWVEIDLCSACTQ